ncbi:MAG: PTS sugar transporter subunit IIA [Pseudomonadota bacterium]
MDLTKILSADHVRILHGVTSKKRLFQSVAALTSPACLEQQDVIAQALMERETLGPTGVGRGVALPHARLNGISHMLGCFIKLDKPIEFSAVDRQPVDLVFSLFGPAAGGADHLKALATVSRTLRDPAVCDKLRSNMDAGTLYEIILGGPATSVAA